MTCCVFTICSRNYLHYAKTLLKSVREHQPELTRIVALCDEPGGIEPPVDPELLEILPMQEIGIPGLEAMISRYTVLEMNTAIKPFVFKHLFQVRGFEQVVYFDPDIRLYRDLSSLFRRMESCSILLTPHITDPIEDKRHPGELTFLLCGTYNLGFIAVKNDGEGNRLMDWWGARLVEDCVVDLPHGLFVDQKWANLMPGLFDQVGICRDPGWNAAYWNLNSRELIRNPDGMLEVNGSPLFFFHFSGVNVEGTVFSSHQDRFSLTGLPAEVRQLMTEYCGRLRENGAEPYRKIQYAYNRFRSGRRIPDFIRRIFRTHPAAAHELGMLTSVEGEEKWIRYALEIPPGFEILNRAALALYELRIDLSNAFPDLPLGNERPYANWFIDNGAQQPDMDPEFVEDVRVRMQEGVRSAHVPPPARHGLKVTLYRRIYQLAWRMQRWVTPLTSMAFRRNVHNLLVRLAYSRRDPPAANPHVIKPPLGANLIGYLKAESGVGRAARLTIQAATEAEIPLHLRNFAVGCLSRQEEFQDISARTASPYGINLFHINADQIPIVHSHLEPELFAGHYNIGFWYWELPEFPESWSEAFQHVDEIWVATSFCQEAIARKSPVPVIKMPPGIDVNPDPSLTRRHFGLPENEFLFLTLADGLSFFERKNVLAALTAFEQAFPPGTAPAKLVVKLMNGALSESGHAAILERIAGNPDLLLLDRTLSRVETDSLIALCDSVVSLHRAEGFGLPLAEAMFLGKPVMATHWSGNTDFMNHDNAFPVACRIVELSSTHGPYEKGMHWAEPDVADAARLFRLLAENGPEVKARAAKGQQTIRTDYAPRVAGERMKERMRWILKRSWGVT